MPTTYKTSQVVLLESLTRYNFLGKILVMILIYSFIKFITITFSIHYSFYNFAVFMGTLAYKYILNTELKFPTNVPFRSYLKFCLCMFHFIFLFPNESRSDNRKYSDVYAPNIDLQNFPCTQY